MVLIGQPDCISNMSLLDRFTFTRSLEVLSQLQVPFHYPPEACSALRQRDLAFATTKLFCNKVKLHFSRPLLAKLSVSTLRSC